MALVVEIEPAQHLVRMHARRLDLRSPQQRADERIVLDRERWKWPDQLERAPDAAPADRIGRQAIDPLAGKGDRALVGREHAGDQIEQRGLAGSVRPDHRENLALADLEAHAVDGGEPAEALTDFFNSKEAHGRRSVSRSVRASQGQMPDGLSTMITMRARP